MAGWQQNYAICLTLGAPGFLYTYKPQSGSIDPNGFSVHSSTRKFTQVQIFDIQLPIEME